mmetsp:Transcript_14540/g.51112  ORF Transcript_14540/g.51112 Transcript_14540/m.51112 type:complete len:284 (+) Transcript_14540:1764-2615(+)
MMLSRLCWESELLLEAVLILLSTRTRSALSPPPALAFGGCQTPPFRDAPEGARAGSPSSLKPSESERSEGVREPPTGAKRPSAELLGEIPTGLRGKRALPDRKPVKDDFLDAFPGGATLPLGEGPVIVTRELAGAAEVLRIDAGEPMVELWGVRSCRELRMVESRPTPGAILSGCAPTAALDPDSPMQAAITLMIGSQPCAPGGLPRICVPPFEEATFVAKADLSSLEKPDSKAFSICRAALLSSESGRTTGLRTPIGNINVSAAAMADQATRGGFALPGVYC